MAVLLIELTFPDNCLISIDYGTVWCVSVFK